MNRGMAMQAAGWLLIAAGGVLALGGATGADAPANARIETAPFAAVSTAVGGEGMVYLRDPETGLPPESPSEAAQQLYAAVENMTARPAVALQERVHANGARSIRAEGGFLNLSVAVVRPDGTAGVECVHGRGELEARLNCAGGEAR